MLLYMLLGLHLLLLQQGSVRTHVMHLVCYLCRQSLHLRLLAELFLLLAVAQPCMTCA